LEPKLVDEETPGSQEKNVAYYIVQFGFKNEFSERKSRMARVYVLVNAQQEVLSVAADYNAGQRTVF
jgi:hypothetical protein